MKKYKFVPLVFISVWGFIYFLGGFIAMDWNAAHWHEFNRAMLAVWGTFVAGGIAVGYALSVHDREDK